MNELQTINSNPVSQNLTSNLYNSYLNFLNGTSATKDTYKRALRQFFIYLNDQGIAQPTRLDIVNYRSWIESHTDIVTGEVITHKPSTIQLYMQAVKLFFSWTETEGLYPNIAKNVKGAKIDRSHKKDYFTADQIKTILEGIDTTTLQGKRDYAIFVLTVTGGLRDIEIVRANVEDLGIAGGNSVLYVQGKGHQERAEYIKLPAHTERIIREYLRERGSVKPNEPLFTGTGNRNRGGRLTTKSVSRLIKGYMVKAGYDNERWTAHSLRHTAVTLSLQAGNSLEETQQFARHSNIATTMIYNHALQKEKNNCSNSVANAIFS